MSPTRSAKLWLVARELDTENMPGIDRLLALTDGVVAIALTLLVLQLSVPVTHSLEKDPSSASALWHSLNVDASEISSYLVSFVIIAQFWLVHHRVLRSMRGHSEGLAWRNFGFLLTLTLMPFTSDLIGRYGDNPLAITMFGLNLVALSLSTQWIFHYAVHHDLLPPQTRSSHDELASRVRVLLVVGVVSLSIVLAWTDANLARYAWLLFLFTATIAERITRRVERARSPSTAQAGR